MRGKPGILPDDETLRDLLRKAQDDGGISKLHRELGVGHKRLTQEALRLGVSGRYKVLRDLPPDGDLVSLICASPGWSPLARQLGVPVYHLRNQRHRLGVSPGSPLPAPKSPVESPEEIARRARENMELFEVASAELAETERTVARLQAELDRLRAEIARDTPPTDLDGILAEAQATGGVVILPRAAKGARKANQLNLAKLRSILLVLRDFWVPMMRGEGDKDFPVRVHHKLVEEGLDLGPPANDLRKLKRLGGYTAIWQGHEVLLSKRIKWGVDPRYLIRVYFHWDDVAKIAVVGSMPDHLPVESYS